MLKSADVDGSFLSRVEIASAHAEIAGRANHAAGETERIVREDRLRRAIVILVGDRSDERLDVQLRGAGLLAGCIGTLEATRCLPQSAALAQGGVLDVVEVLGERHAALGAKTIQNWER